MEWRGRSAFVYSLFLNEAISSSSGSRTVDNPTTPVATREAPPAGDKYIMLVKIVDVWSSS